MHIKSPYFQGNSTCHVVIDVIHKFYIADHSYGNKKRWRWSIAFWMQQRVVVILSGPRLQKNGRPFCCCFTNTYIFKIWPILITYDCQKTWPRVMIVCHITPGRTLSTSPTAVKRFNFIPLSQPKMAIELVLFYQMLGDYGDNRYFGEYWECLSPDSYWL